MKFFNWLYIGKWDHQIEEMVWFHYLKGSCGCRFLTICNVLIMTKAKDCEW